METLVLLVLPEVQESLLPTESFLLFLRRNVQEGLPESLEGSLELLQAYGEIGRVARTVVG